MIPAITVIGTAVTLYPIGACVAEITGMLDLSAWPKGMRVIVRKERAAPR